MISTVTFITDWRRTARSIVLQKIFYFYGLAADRQEYCFTKDFFLFYFFILFFFSFIFLKFIFEPKPL